MRQRSRPVRSPSGEGRVRIIAGRWRGRHLGVADLPGLRPTPDRLRETLFNWLSPELPAARCLDLFAGSGALGLEALSRGASAAVLVESGAKAVTRLRENIAVLAAESAEVVGRDALTWLQQAPVTPFDIAFLDPPFGSDLLLPACRLLLERGWLKQGGLLYLESGVGTAAALDLPAELTPHREARAGQVACRLLRYTVG